MLSPARHRTDREAGVSLIEILVGISIMAIVAFAVTLTLRPGDGALAREADRLGVRLNQAAAEAIATGQPIGLVIEANGQRYGFYRYVDRRWWPLRDHPTLEGHDLGSPVRLSATQALFQSGQAGVDRELAPTPVIWFDPAGLTEPFSLRLDADGDWLELAWTTGGRLERRGEART